MKASDAELQELTRLIALMAHDLKNPLSALITNLHFVKGSRDEATEMERAEALRDSLTLCEVLGRFIRNLETVACIGKLPRHAALVDLQALAREVVRRIEVEAAYADVVLEVIPSGSGEVLAVLDAEPFGYSLENVIAFAFEHAPSGSKIRVEVGRSGGEASLSVSYDRRSFAAHAPAMGAQPDKQQATRVRYGRGLALLSAEIAARAAGAVLEVDKDHPGISPLRLIAPLGP